MGVYRDVLLPPDNKTILAEKNAIGVADESFSEQRDTYMDMLMATSSASLFST